MIKAANKGDEQHHGDTIPKNDSKLLAHAAKKNYSIAITNSRSTLNNHESNKKLRHMIK